MLLLILYVLHKRFRFQLFNACNGFHYVLMMSSGISNIAISNGY